jgi:hypothetical protein
LAYTILVKNETKNEGKEMKDLTPERLAKLKSPKKSFVFFRAEGFYIVEIPEATLEDNVKSNPGTVRVETIEGEIVWLK